MVKITYLGHSSFKIESSSGVIITDPYADDSVPGLKFPRGQVCDFLFVSHEHHDHNARELVIAREGKTIGYQEHMVAHDKNGGKERGLTKIFIIYVENYKIAHLGDIGDVTNPKAVEYLKGMDVIFAPINNYFTIGPDELKILADAVKPKLIIPMHFYNKDKKSGYDDGNQMKNSFNKFQRIGTGLIVFIVVGLIWSAMYLSFTTIGNETILGVQARYYLPLMLPTSYILSTKRIKLDIKTGTLWRIFLGIAVFFECHLIYNLILLENVL